MIKRAAVSLIGWAVARLPHSVRQRLLDALCEQPEGAIEIIARMAPRIGITEIGATGDYGLILGSSRDKIVVPRYAQTGAWARGIDALFVQFFAGGSGTYFDVGANVGLTTIPVAQNALVKCLAFEPEPLNFAHLRDNIRRNTTHGNVELHQVAIIDHRAPVMLGIAEGNIGDNRVGYDEGGKRRMVQVPGVPLDDFHDRIDGALAIKIDVQGAEPFAIAGGPKTLARADLVIMEFWPHGMREVGSDPEITIDFVAGLSRVALMTGDGDGNPVYLRPSEACAQLRRMLRNMRSRESIDVVGRR